MKIAFARISDKDLHFDIAEEELNFSGFLKKINQKSVKCLGKITGQTTYNCDRCGAEMLLNLDQDVELILNDGIYKDPENELNDVIEFFDGQINLNEVFQGEIETFKSDYFYCENCKNL